MWSWVAANAVELVGAAWTIREIWAAKGRKRAKALETAREAQRVYERIQWNEAIGDLREANRDVPEQILEWRRKIDESERKLLAMRGDKHDG